MCLVLRNKDACYLDDMPLALCMNGYRTYQDSFVNVRRLHIHVVMQLEMYF